MKITRFDVRNRHGYRIEDDDGSLIAKDLVGITTVLNVMDKPGLVPWAARLAADAFKAEIRKAPDLSALAPLLEADGYRIAEDFRDRAASRGTDGHKVAELLAIAYAHGDDLSDDLVREMLRANEPLTGNDVYLCALAMRDWLMRVKPKILRTEFCVACVTCKYGATPDLECEFDGRRWLIDLKTGSGIYDSTAIQLHAQLHAMHQNGHGHVVGGNDSHSTAALWIGAKAKNGAELVPTRACDEALSAVLTLYHWRRENGWRR